MARDEKQAGNSLKTKKPQCGNTEASGINEVNDQENNVMSDISTAATNVIQFSFGKQQVRTLLIDGQPWFVAVDVCEALAIVNTARALSRLDDDEKGIHSMNTPGGQQNLSVVNESGLYSLILTSRKAEAKLFKKWVTAEVLPAIRKQGRYEDVAGQMKPLVQAMIGQQGAQALSNVIRCRVAKLDHAHQRSASMKLSSALHARFNVPRVEQIPGDQMEAACNFVAAYALEGEYLPRNDGTSVIPDRLSQDQRFLVSADPNGNKQIVPVPMDAYVLSRQEFMKSMLIDGDMPVSTEEMFQFVTWATENLRRRSLHQSARRAAA